MPNVRRGSYSNNSRSSSGSNVASNQVSFQVGNTYRRIPEDKADYDRSGRMKKIHDVTIFLDVIEGDVNVIERVEFDMMNSTFSPRVFPHFAPTRTSDDNYRFASRQTMYGMISEVKITIFGRGGTKYSVTHELSTREVVRTPQFFTERKSIHKPIGPVPIPSHIEFGMELELTTSADHTPETVAQTLQHYSGLIVQLQTYSEAKNSPYTVWKITHDSSIACHANRPDCNTFELVSPVLKGNEGLEQCNTILTALRQAFGRSVKVNKSMGFHVHVNVSTATKRQLTSICQNFIKYEPVMDSIMPGSRRKNNNTFCKSNKLAVPGSTTNKQRHERLQNTNSIPELVDAISPTRYYKLNLQNVIQPNRASTVEFRQHSSTTNSEKILNWIRFCILFVTNSCKFPPKSVLKANRTVEEQRDLLFQYVIKDRCLHRFYETRAQQLEHEHEANHDHGGACCNSCARGGPCTKR